MASRCFGFCKRWVYLLLTLAAATMFAGCSAGPSGGTATGVSPSVQEASYLIGPGDKVDVLVWQNPDLSVSVPVRPDGRISLPLLQDVEAAQKSPAQLAGEIERGL